jgi:hypothetical protein
VDQPERLKEAAVCFLKHWARCCCGHAQFVAQAPRRQDLMQFLVAHGTKRNLERLRMIQLENNNSFPLFEQRIRPECSDASGAYPFADIDPTILQSLPNLTGFRKDEIRRQCRAQPILATMKKIGRVDVIGVLIPFWSGWQLHYVISLYPLHGSLIGCRFQAGPSETNGPQNGADG